MKRQKNFRLDEATILYIHDFKSQRNLADDTAALLQIIEDHKHRNDVPASKLLVDSLAKQVAEELKDTLTRIRLGTNNADRNSDVMLLLLNTLLSYSGFKSLIEKDTPQLEEARRIVKDRIAHYRQRRLDKSTKKIPEDTDLLLENDLLL